MSRGAKILLGIMLAIIIWYIVSNITGLNNSNENIENSGDSLVENSGDEADFDLEYEITSGDNDITITVPYSGDISITKYIFEDEKLSKILLEERIVSGDFAEEIYNHYKEDSEISIIYKNIELSGDSIFMELRDEYVQSYGEKSKAEIYEDISEKTMK